MTTVKSLAIIALLVGGTSLAVAQGSPTGGYPPVSGGAGGNPATNPVTPGPPGPGVIPHDVAPGQSAARPATGASSGTRIAHHQTTKQKKMYMSARSHKGSKQKLTPTGTAKPQMKQ